MNYFIELVVSGLAIGAIYGLVAMSFAVIFKATGIVNFAQGEMGMLTAYTSWSIATALGTDAVSTILVSVAVGAALGLVCHGMAGFDRDRARGVLHVPEDVDVEVMIAVGRPGDPHDLPEKYRDMDLSPTGRKAVREFVREGSFAF